MTDTDIWMTFTDDQLVFLRTQPGPVKRQAEQEQQRRSDEAAAQPAPDSN